MGNFLIVPLLHSVSDVFMNGVEVLYNKKKTGHLYLRMLGPGYVSELNVKEMIWTMEIGNTRKL